MPPLRRIRAARALFGGFACGMALAVLAGGGALAATTCPCAKVKLFVDCSAADPDEDMETADGDGTETDPYVRLSDISGRRLAPGSLGIGRPGAVGWNLDGADWDPDHNLLHGVPAPTTAADVVRPDPMLAAAESNDPLGYQLLAGSPALGSGRPLGTLRGFPLSCQEVPAASPNLGAVQAPAGFPPSLAEPFDEDPAGHAPKGWTIISRPAKATGAAVAPDPEGFTGQALALRPPAAAVRDFPATGGDLRADARIWTQGHGALRVQLLDRNGKRIADAGFDGSGALIYRDARAVRTTGFTAPAGAWTRLALILDPGDGTYDVWADGTVLATAKAGAGMPSAIALTAPEPRKGPPVAADDVLVLPSTCSS